MRSTCRGYAIATAFASAGSSLLMYPCQYPLQDHLARDLFGSRDGVEGDGAVGAAEPASRCARGGHGDCSLGAGQIVTTLTTSEAIVARARACP
jgi:hypothetical protein